MTTLCSLWWPVAILVVVGGIGAVYVALLLLVEVAIAIADRVERRRRGRR